VIISEHKRRGWEKLTWGFYIALAMVQVVVMLRWRAGDGGMLRVVVVESEEDMWHNLNQCHPIWQDVGHHPRKAISSTNLVPQ